MTKMTKDDSLSGKKFKIIKGDGFFTDGETVKADGNIGLTGMVMVTRTGSSGSGKGRFVDANNLEG